MRIFKNYWWISVDIEMMHLSKKDNKLLINRSYHNSVIMEYQKIANLLKDESNQPSKFRTR